MCKLSCIKNIQFCCVNSVDEIFFFCFPSKSKPHVLLMLQAVHIRVNSDLTVLSPLVRKLLTPLVLLYISNHHLNALFPYPIPLFSFWSLHLFPHGIELYILRICFNMPNPILSPGTSPPLFTTNAPLSPIYSHCFLLSLIKLFTDKAYSLALRTNIMILLGIISEMPLIKRIPLLLLIPVRYIPVYLLI